MRIALAAAATLALAGLSISPAAAQRLTTGVLSPHQDVAAGDHAEAIEANPAGLGFGERFQLAYTYLGSNSDRSGQGHGAWLSLGLFDPYHTGFGLSWLDLPGNGDTLPVKFTWAHALRLIDGLSIGLSWSTFSADGEPDDPRVAYDGVETVDLGLQVRPLRWLSAGFTVTDLGRPIIGETRVERGYELGVAIRPGTERMHLSGVTRFDESDADPTFGARLSIRLFSRLALVARYDTDTYITDEVDSTRRHRIMLGLSDQGLAGGGLFWYAPDAADSDGRAGWSITGRIRDRAPEHPSLLRRPVVAEVIIGPATEYATTGLFARSATAPFLATLRQLRRLERHPEVKGVLLAFTSDAMGWAQAAELRAAITRLRAAGKTVYAWLPVGDTRTYSVAAAADRVFTTHAGGVLLTGLKGETLYLGTLLERLGVEAQFVATGAYKSAPETFTRRGPSDGARENQDTLLDDLYARVVGAIAAGRGLSADRVKALIDAGPYTAQDAEQKGLVDGVIHYDEFDGLMREQFGRRVRFTRAPDLLDVRDERWGTRPEVAVLYAVGTLVDGPSTVNPLTGAATTGSETLAEAAEALRRDPSVKAVVLRIDSPGGSVTASDVMWRALTRLAEVKPLIVSMGDIAASGGYYIAVAGETILATPETITGSIGVFSGKFDVSGLYRGLGMETVIFPRGARADLMSMQRRWNDDELAAVQSTVDTLYDLFLERVAAGRETLKKDQVGPLGGGRVWTGAQARACGLVDRPEGLMTAIDLAALRAGVDDDDYQLGVYPGPAGLGALPGTPLGRIPGLAASVEWVASTLLGGAHLGPGVPPLLARALDLPVLQFASGTPLALLPFTWLDD